MRVVLWDTRQLDVSKDFAGGFGVGQYHGRGGLRGRIVRWFYKRDHRPTSLALAYLVAVFRTLGHEVDWCEDADPPPADLYVFHPALITLHRECEAIRQLNRQRPAATVLVVGPLAQVLPEAFDGLRVTLVQGEPEQLLWKLDTVLAAGEGPVAVGSVRQLDALPFPDWSLFDHQRFRIGYDFSRFPTGLVQQSRGCTFTCDYCPYILVENRTRFRSPESVVAEIDRGRRQFGFRSFKFRDPLFGLDRQRVLKLAELIGRLPYPVQFSIESRIDLLKPDTLRALRAVGLTSVTVGIETPDDSILRRHKRLPLADDRQRQFIDLCRSLGIRTVAGFMIGFPDDTPQSVRRLLRYAKRLNPTFANFNIVTPYPGTAFFDQVRSRIADFDVAHYDVYTPVLEYEHMTADEIRRWHVRCFERFYFRWQWLQANAHTIWPWLPRWSTRPEPVEPDAEPATAGPALPRIPPPHKMPNVSRAETPPHACSAR